MKVLGICGSPRTAGNTKYMIKKVLKSAKKAGARTEYIFLGEKNIKWCDGCLTCHKTNKCHIKDDMQLLYKKILKADAIIFGSPSYFSNIGGLLKNFFDRMTAFYIKDRSKRPLKGKKYAAMAVGERKMGLRKTIEAIKVFCTWHQQMNCVGTVTAKAVDIGEVNGKVDDKLVRLGQKLTK